MCGQKQERKKQDKDGFHCRRSRWCTGGVQEKWKMVKSWLGGRRDAREGGRGVWSGQQRGGGVCIYLYFFQDVEVSPVLFLPFLIHYERLSERRIPFMVARVYDMPSIRTLSWTHSLRTVGLFLDRAPRSPREWPAWYWLAPTGEASAGIALAWANYGEGGCLLVSRTGGWIHQCDFWVNNDHTRLGKFMKRWYLKLKLCWNRMAENGLKCHQWSRLYLFDMTYSGLQLSRPTKQLDDKSKKSTRWDKYVMLATVYLVSGPDMNAECVLCPYDRAPDLNVR